ncbi:MAG: DUF302 domain-containing protein [Rhizobiales bacterium]|nr:DUF302 domain-containing protein [Hyphomicrobiales bacterium]
MRKLFLAFAFLLVAPQVHAEGIGERPGWVVIETEHSYKGLVESLTKAVKANKMGLVNRASASTGAARQKITIPGNQVVGVYRNDYARRMLEASLAAGIEAPIRYYLTENADGTSTLSYRTPSAVFEPYFDEGGEALKSLASELDEVFATIADQAANGG